MTELCLACAAVWLLWGAGTGVRALARIPREGAVREFPRALVVGLTACGFVAPVFAALGFHAVAGTAAVLSILTVFGVGLRRRRGVQPGGLSREPASGLALLAIPFATALYFAVGSGLTFGDEVSVWGYKAAVLAETGRLVPTEWSQWTSRGPSYPVSLPVAGSLASLPVDRLSAVACRAMALAGFAAFAVALAELWGFATSRKSRALAAAAIAVMPAVLHESTLFMADFWLAAAVALAAISVLESSLDASRGTEAALAIACVPLVKLDGLSIAALLLVSGVILRPRGARLAWFGAAAVGVAVALAPWWGWCLRCGIDPTSGIPLDGASRPSAAVQILTDPIECLRRTGSSAAALLDTLLGSGALPRQVTDAVPFLALPVILAAAAAAGAPQRSAPRRATAILALAIFLGQCIPFALAPNFDWQLEVARTRASIHVLPALVLLAATLRRLDRPGALP